MNSQQREFMDERGYLILQQVLGPEQVEELRGSGNEDKEGGYAASEVTRPERLAVDWHSDGALTDRLWIVCTRIEGMRVHKSLCRLHCSPFEVDAACPPRTVLLHVLNFVPVFESTGEAKLSQPLQM